VTPARPPELATAPPPVIPEPTTDPPTSDRGPGRPRDERATSAITDAAVRQLNELGYANVSMESVAAEAGVARATVYRRYRDKADLITAAIAANSATHLVSLPSEDVRSDLISYLTAFDDRFAESCLEVVGALIGARQEPGDLALHRQRVVEPNMKYARSLLIRAVELGLLEPDADLDLALQMLTGAVFARRMSGTPSTPNWAERAVDTVLAGMRHR
jgi:AcrR family transcriptional regulator